MAVVTTVLLTQISRTAGQITSATFTAPQVIPVPLFEVFCVMNPVDIADNTLSIGLALQIQNSVTSVFDTVGSLQWVGNSITDKIGNTGLAPYISWNATSVKGVVCRAILTLPKTLNIGLTGRITT